MILLSKQLRDGHGRAWTDARTRYWDESALTFGSLDDRIVDAFGAAVDARGTLGEAGRHHLRSGGKRVRGRLALAAGMSLGQEPETAARIAVAVELLHGASLVHDDLQDGDRLRRGTEAVWSRFGRDTALLLGDALIAAAFAQAASAAPEKASELTRLMAECVGALSAGQLRDTKPAPPDEWSLGLYETVARHKTGRLLALPLELAVAAADGADDARHGVREVAELLGIAYQVWDDLADFTGTKGRARATDVRNRRMSAVLVHALRLAEPSVRNTLVRELASPAQRSTVGGLRPSVRSLQRLGSVPACLLHQRHVLRRANEAAEPLPLELRETLGDFGRELADGSFQMCRGVEEGGSPFTTPLPEVNRVLLRRA